jgi:hypothetical protein
MRNRDDDNDKDQISKLVEALMREIGPDAKISVSMEAREGESPRPKMRPVIVLRSVDPPA